MTYTVKGGANAGIRLGVTDEVESVLQDVATVLSTPKGSVPMYREFGLDTRSLDRPVNVAKVLLIADIKEQVERFVPEVEVVRVTFEEDRREPGRLVPTVEVKLRDEQT